MLEFHNLNHAAQYILANVAGMDEESPHTERTAARFLKMLKEMTTPEDFHFTTFPTKIRNMVVVKRIPIVSLCEHHVVPFLGHADIGYIPQDHIAGLSKIARLAQNQARALCVQEELTEDIADQLEKRLGTEDVAVVMECEHLCMTIRGVQAPGTTTYTATMRGVFGIHERTAKDEFLKAIGQ